MEDDEGSSNTHGNTLDSASSTFFHGMDNSNNFDPEVLRGVGEQSISAEWTATSSALNSSGTTLSNSCINIGTLKECCANPSDTLEYKEQFNVLENTAVNITNFTADDTQFLSTPKVAFQKKHKPYSHNFSNAFENIIDNSEMDITQNSLCLNRFQKRQRFLHPNEDDFVQINNSNISGMDSVEESIKSPKFRFLNKNKNRSCLPDYNLSITCDSSIVDANLHKIKDYTIFKEPSELSPVNNSSKIVSDLSKTEDLTLKFTPKKMDVNDSVFGNIISDSSMSSNKALNNQEISSNYTTMADVNRSSIYNTIEQSCLNHTYDIPANCNSTKIVSLSQSEGQQNNETYTVENDLTSNKSNNNGFSSSVSTKNCTFSDTYTLETNLNDTLTQTKSHKKIYSLTDPSNKSVTQHSNILRDLVFENDKNIPDSPNSLKHRTLNGSYIKSKFNFMGSGISNVSINDKLNKQNNLLNSEDSFSESLPSISVDLLENDDSSSNRLTRSRSKSLLDPSVTDLSFELNKSSSSSKQSSTSMNISKPVKFKNHNKIPAQSAIFENLITNSQESNLTLTQNKMLSNTELKDQSKIQGDDISVFENMDDLSLDSNTITHTSHYFKENVIDEVSVLNNSKHERDLKNISKGSSSTTKLMKENCMGISNVSVNNNLHEQHNLLNSEDSLASISVDLLENDGSSSNHLMRSRSKSFLDPSVTDLSFELNKSSSTSMNISKPVKFKNHNKIAAQSAIFENLLTNSQESNLTLKQNQMSSNSELNDKSKIEGDEISMFANMDDLSMDSNLIKRTSRSFKKNIIGEVSILKNSNHSEDELDLNSSKGSSSTTEVLKENGLGLSNVSVNKNLHVQHNLLNSEDSFTESLPSISADLLENNGSSNNRLTRSRSKSLLDPSVTDLSYELNKSSSSSKQSNTSMNISKPVKFKNYNKMAAQSAIFENLITNTQESNLTLTQNKFLSNTELKDQSKIEGDEISVFANMDDLSLDSNTITHTSHSFKENVIDEVSVLNNSKDELDLKNISKGSSSTTKLMKKNCLGISNVSVNNNLHEQHNLLNSEDSFIESLPSISVDLLENDDSSSNRLTRSRSKSLLDPSVTDLSFELNKSSSSSKQSSTSMNISKPVKFKNHNKIPAQSAIFENLITNSQESNLTLTQNKMLSNTELKDQSKIQGDEISVFENMDDLSLDSYTVTHTSHTFKENVIDEVSVLNNSKHELDLINISKGSSSTTKLMKENCMGISNVSVNNNLHEQHNLLNSEDSLASISVDLLENEGSSSNRLTRSRSKSLLDPSVTDLSFELNKSSSSSKQSSTSINISKSVKFKIHNKIAAQSAIFENLITNSQESNLTLKQNQMSSNSELNDKSKIEGDEISMFANMGNLSMDSNSIKRTSRSFKKNIIGEVSILKNSNHSKDELDLKNSSKSSSSTTEVLKENGLGISNVSVNDNLQEQNNLLNSEDSFTEPLPSISADLLENNSSSNNRLTRSRTNSLLVPSVTDLSFELNKSSSSSIQSNTSMNISKSVQIKNPNKNAAQSVKFESSKQKRKSIENEEQETSNENILKKSKSTNPHVTSSSSVSFNKTKSLKKTLMDQQPMISENLNCTITYSHKTSETQAQAHSTKENISDKESVDSLFDKSIFNNSTNKSTTMKASGNTFLTPTNNKITIAENIVNTIGKMSVIRRKSGHPGVFQFQNISTKPRIHVLDQSNSFLTRALAGTKNNEPESTLCSLSDPETIIDPLKIEVAVNKKFKSLYNNEPWITKRLYSFIVNKLEPRYSIYAVKHAEHFIKYLALRLKDVLYNRVNFELCSDMLRYHMARYEIISTTFDYLEFLSKYIPAQYFDKLVPETFDQRFDPKKYFLPIMDDEEFLNEVLIYLNTE